MRHDRSKPTFIELETCRIWVVGLNDERIIPRSIAEPHVSAAQ